MLEIIPSSELTFTTSGDDIPGDEKNNLCLKAYQLLKKKFSLGAVHIHLHKTIPTGAGLGGGSADAAYTLLTLNILFSLNLSQSELVQYASQLGSDCAFFIYTTPMIGTSRGEVLNPIALSLKGKYLVLIKPDVHISTAEAYAGIVPQPNSFILSTILSIPFQEWRSCIVNDFEENLFTKYPRLQSLKNSLYECGAWYASMSGSGSSVYGLFDAKPDTAKLENVIWSGSLN